MKDTIILVTDKKTGSSLFAVYGSTLDKARQKLDQCKLNKEEFTFMEIQDGKLFDYYIKEFEPKEYKPVDPVEFLHKMIEIARDNQPDYSHVTADKLICEALKNCDIRFAPGLMIFENMEKWYS